MAGGTAPYTYSWALDDQNNYSSNEDVGLHETGVYAIDVNDQNNCSNSISFVIDSEQLACKTLNIDIYPNPNEGIFTLSFKTCVDNAKVELFDLLGKKIFKITTSELVNMIELPTLASGQYVLLVNMNGKSMARLIEVMK